MTGQTFKFSARRVADIRLGAGVQILLAIVFMIASSRVARLGHVWPSASLGLGAVVAMLAANRSIRIYSSARQGELDILIESEFIRVSPRLTLKKGELGRVTSKGLRRDAPGTLFLEVRRQSQRGLRTVRVDARAYEGGMDLMAALSDWATAATA